MWNAVVLAACLLVSVTLPAEGNPTFGIKLCGREFIRAVIFTCGGSRWRRALGPGDILPSHDDEVSDSWIADSIFSLTYPEADNPKWERKASEQTPFIRLARSSITEEMLEALSASRMERDVVVGLSNACCKWGCSKSEISSLC